MRRKSSKASKGLSVGCVIATGASVVIDYVKSCSGLLVVTVLLGCCVALTAYTFKQNKKAVKVEAPYVERVIADLQAKLISGDITEQEYNRRLELLAEESESNI